MNGFIPEEVIEEVRRNSDIVDVISEYVLLKKKGQNYFGLCPFHGEKTSSFSVSPDKQIFHCFGCGIGGNVITFIMETDKLPFPEAVRFLAEKAGVEVPEKVNDPKLVEEREAKKRAYGINNLAKDFYHYILQEMKVAHKAKGYLENRGITFEISKEFQLGYAPNSWDGILKFLTKKGYTQGELKEIGLVLPGKNNRSHYDRFRDRVIFPIWDVKDNVIGFGGRVLDQGEPKYLNSPETFIYNKRFNLYGINLASKYIRELNQVIIVEGYLDVITAHQYGIKNVIASLGTALTKEQVKLIMRFTHEVVIAYDADTAGVNATLKGIDLLQKMGCNAKILSVPNGKDPDDFIREKGAAGFKKLSEKALPLIDFKLKKAIEQYGLERPESKIKIVHQLGLNLFNLPSEVEKEIYFKKVASTLDLQVETIIAEVKKLQKPAKPWQYRDKITKNRNNNTNKGNSVPKKKENPVSARSKGEKFLLRMIFENPDLWQRVQARLGISFFGVKEYNVIAQIVNKLIEKNSSLEAAEMYNYLEDEDSIKALNEILAQNLPLDHLEESFEDCLNLIEKEVKKEEKESLLGEVDKAEKEGNFLLVKELMLKIRQIH